jgi:hypothetical protein
MSFWKSKSASAATPAAQIAGAGKMKKLLLLLLLVLAGRTLAQNHTEVTIEDTQTVTGNKTFTGTVTGIFTASTAQGQPGASVGAQIDNACTSLNGTKGTIVIPASLGAGNSLIGIPDNCTVIDLRGVTGPNQAGTEGLLYTDGMLLRQRWTTDADAGAVYAPLHLHAQPWAGGFNGNGHSKTTYGWIQGSMDARTQGQKIGMDLWQTCMGMGDCQTIDALAWLWGGITDSGGEGAVSFRGDVQQRSDTPTGTIATIVGNVITMSGLSNPQNFGELRYLIDTTSPYVTGTVSSISGTPPTVAGNGTAFAAQFGGGAHTNLCFSLNNGNTNDSTKFVVPIRSITNDTTLILNMQYANADTGWNGDASTGNYKIYKCSQITAVTFPGTNNISQVTVSDGTQFSISDAVESPVWYGVTMTGIKQTITAHTALSGTGVGIQIINQGTRTLTSAFQASGPWQTGLDLSAATISQQGVALGNMSVGIPLAFINDTNTNHVVDLLWVTKGAGGATAKHWYDKTTNTWKWAGGLHQIDETNGAFAAGAGLLANYAGYISAYPNYTHALELVPSANDGSSRILDSQYGGVYHLAINYTDANFGASMKLNGCTGSLGSTGGGTCASPLWQLDGGTGKVKASLIATVTNCAAVGTAANPSVAACSAAPSGAFSCATNASTGTCQVNTTAVTANSNIIVQQVVSEGARLSVTCNTGSVLPAGPLLLSKSAGASFTLTMGTITTNPGCFVYWIVN